MIRIYCLLFLVLLSYVTWGTSFSLPNIVTDSCYPSVEQDCDETTFDNQTDAIFTNSTMRFFLFTRWNPMQPEMLHMCNGRLPKNTNFNPKRRLIVVIPGFFYGLCQLEIIMRFKDEFLEKDDFNVLLVDDRKEYGLDYVNAEKNLDIISSKIAKVLQNIQDQTGLKSKNVYLVGHSLGAQLAAYVGRKFKVQRITGIDPAGPRFEDTQPISQRLDRTDANLVDIIHCNGGRGIPNFGIIYPAGDADFYINGGTRQYDCNAAIQDALRSKDYGFSLALSTGPTVCAHIICLYYYHLSINNKYGQFKGWRCDSHKHFEQGKCTGVGNEPVIMGFDYEKNFTETEKYTPTPRKYYLDTRKKYPFVKKDGGLPNHSKLYQ